MAYKTPTLTELVAQFLLDDQQIDQGQVLDLVQRARAKGLGTVELAPRFEVPRGQQSVPLVAAVRFLCWSEDRRLLAQVGPDIVAANQVGEYLGWSRFREHAESVLGLLDGIAKPASVLLQAVDEIDSIGPDEPLGRYLNCGSRYIPALYSDRSEPCDISLGLGVLERDGFNRQLKIRMQRVADKKRLRWNTVIHESISNGSALDKLEHLHGESNAMFEEMITSATREHMGGTV